MREGGLGSRRLIDWERLARAQSKPARISVLELLAIDGGRTLSPAEMAFELQVDTKGLNYHVRVLEEMGLLKLIREHQVRGANEHFYQLTVQPSQDGSRNQM